MVLDDTTVLHLATDLSCNALAVDAAFWRHGTDRREELADGRILCTSTYDRTWTWWERHPDGDEIAIVLDGGVVVQVGDRSVPLAAGEAALIPAGAWHRLAIDAPVRLLFITPTPARTEQRAA